MYILGAVFILVGFFVILSGIIGLFRLPDFYTKIHAASLIESCGIPFTLVGLACFQTNIFSSLKILALILIIYLLNPVATHALGKASLVSKQSKRNAN
jgi:multicomponent Na+:H+ antiporter subunit G